MILHVYPTNEEDLHELNGRTCLCGGMVQLYNQRETLIHNPIEDRTGA